MKVTDIKNTDVELSSENYENIFNVYTDENAFYYYDLLKTVDFPTDLDSEVYDYYQVNSSSEFYPSIAYKFYKNVKLWWVICAANQIENPTAAPSAGTVLKIIKPNYVKIILSKISEG